MEISNLELYYKDTEEEKMAFFERISKFLTGTFEDVNNLITLVLYEKEDCFYEELTSDLIALEKNNYIPYNRDNILEFLFKIFIVNKKYYVVINSIMETSEQKIIMFSLLETNKTGWYHLYIDMEISVVKIDNTNCICARIITEDHHGLRKIRDNIKKLHRKYKTKQKIKKK